MRRQHFMVWMMGGVLCVLTRGQTYTNLVNNPSFEDTILYYCDINSNLYTACPENRVDFCKARYWYRAFPYCGNSPDYYNACNNYLPPPFKATAGVPKNETGFQYARTGQAYTGIVLWTIANTYPLPGIQYYEGWNEYIGNTLKEPLKKDHLYCITFYTNRANSGGYAINRMGAYLSPDSIVHPPIDCYAFPPPEVFIDLTPTFEDTTLVTDTLNWVPLQGVFTATGGEKYLILGRFTRWNKCRIQCFLPYDWCSTHGGDGYAQDAYYYIDDVSIIEVSPAKASYLPSYTLCPGSSLMLGTDSTEDAEYNWYPPTFLSCTNCPYPVASPTTSITYHLVKKHCKITTTDSVQIIIQQTPQFTTIPNEYSICPNDTFSFKLSSYPNTNIQWTPGTDTYLDTNNIWHAFPPSNTQYIFEQTWCYSQKKYDTIEIKISECFNLSIPNVFTPNNDGINDEWFIQWKNDKNIDLFSVNIFDRWGIKVFYSENKYFKWNGQCLPEEQYIHLPNENNQCPTGTYYYIIEYFHNGKKKEHKGYLTLLR